MKRKLYSMYSERALQIVPKVLPYIKKKDRILDLGCGTGAISRLIKTKNGNDLTLVDVQFNNMCDQFPVIIYDGKKLPFKKNQFSTTLLITVLHHSQNPKQLLDQVATVTSGNIIIIEDIFTDILGRVITFIGDCIVNWEIHPIFRNHTKAEWIRIFQNSGLKILEVKEFKLRCIGFPFKLAIFVTRKKT